MTNDAASVLRELITLWTDFETRLNLVPLIDKLNRGKFRIDDYKSLLINHRQQVVEGSRWIARAASSIESPYLDHRSSFLKHAATEHLDYLMLEESFITLGGTRDEIRNAPKNIGTEALHAFMFQRASLPNPFDLLGAMFIIEGLGQRKAASWGRKIQDQLNLSDDQVKFLIYHGEHDGDHLNAFEDILKSGILDLPNLAQRIVKTAKVTARLYRLQLEEIGHF